MPLRLLEGLVLASGVMLVAGGYSNTGFFGFLLIFIGYGLILVSVWVRDWDWDVIKKASKEILK